MTATFVSTSDPAATATLSRALFRGLAPDGGLYMPERIPRLPPAEMERLGSLGWPEVAGELSTLLLGDALDSRILRDVAEQALTFPLPVVRLEERIFVMELFRGPTLAFKDVGARFMARLMAHFRRRESPPLTILTATSGDTGGAVAQAFMGLAGIRVVVLFPDGKVTPRQERQFSTLGGNVEAVAVKGDFDDCQRLAKAAFRDPELRKRSNLTSANSINVGRFLPQSFYYVYAKGEVERMGRGDVLDPGEPRRPILFCVPSGNFGNLAAGLLAKAMGLEGCSFLAATNANDEVPEFLDTGRFTPRPSIPTLSTAMDVGDPSNLDRILHLYGHDLARLRADLTARRVSDAETRETIRRIFQDRGYLLDPHSAVGYAALKKELEPRPNGVGVLLATAHPAKFAEIVEPVIGKTLPLPAELARCMEGNRRVVPMEPELEALKGVLLAPDTSS